MSAEPSPDFDVVVPTVGRPSLHALLGSLVPGTNSSGTHLSGTHLPGRHRPGRIVLVDDRPQPEGDLSMQAPPALADRVRVVHSGGRGPAAARNLGWRAATARWIAFLDDDVLAPPGWADALCADLVDLPTDVAASQGRIQVPLPVHRAPTDWERNVAGLERARWATADMAYRRSVLVAVGGFDERFPRAYREDADLGLRVTGRGYRIVRGRRSVIHPVRPADWATSVRLQRGNADDVLMAALHGRGWRERAGIPRGARRTHLTVTALAVGALSAAVTGRDRLARMAGLGWLLGTARFAWQRTAPGPRSADEIVRMAVTSVAIPPAASAHWLGGWARLPSRLRHVGAAAPALAAVLFDRDGTLVADVAYNGDPDRVEPVPGARASLARLRRAGIRTGVVSNQSAVGRGLLSRDDVDAVNRRIDELLGPFDVWRYCPHAPRAGCDCRKPAPGLVVEAAHALRVPTAACAVVGDTGADVAAALAAGARAVLVPNVATLPEEVGAAPVVAPDIESAVDLLLHPAGADELPLELPSPDGGAR